MEQGVHDWGAAAGVHRVLEPPGALPYAAARLDTSPGLHAGEVRVDVECLNVDSASWTQLRHECGDSRDRLTDRVLEIVRATGKLHNPVTGSGGMLLGRVSGVGEGRTTPRVGTRVCSLVSLTCTPLTLAEIVSLSPASPQVAVRGSAILAPAAGWVEVPDEIPDDAFLTAMDVVGAPAWAARLVAPGMHVAVVGAGGHAGVLTTAEASRRVGPDGAVLGLCGPPESLGHARAAGAHRTAAVDCTDPLEVERAVRDQFDGRLADLVFVCANVSGCEGGAILATHDAGRVVFFSMATSFTAAALIAESMSRSCELTIGTGYVPGGAEDVTETLLANPGLVELLQEAPPALGARTPHDSGVVE